MDKKFRDEIITELYQSLRDALNSFLWTKRVKNNVVFYKDDKKITVSFKIKVEDSELKKVNILTGLDPE